MITIIVCVWGWGGGCLVAPDYVTVAVVIDKLRDISSRDESLCCRPSRLTKRVVPHTHTHTHTHTLIMG